MRATFWRIYSCCVSFKSIDVCDSYRVRECELVNQCTISSIYDTLQGRRTDRKAMRKQLVLIIPILAAMIGMIAIVGLNTVDANMTSSGGNYTSGANATSGNMTSGNATSDSPTNMTTP